MKLPKDRIELEKSMDWALGIPKFRSLANDVVTRKAEETDHELGIKSVWKVKWRKIFKKGSAILEPVDMSTQDKNWTSVAQFSSVETIVALDQDSSNRELWRQNLIQGDQEEMQGEKWRELP